MKTTHRPYADDAGDFFRLSRFMRDDPTAVRAYSTWCLGRLVDWKYGLYESKTAVPGFCDQNAHLWFDAFGDLAAFAISEDGNTDVAILTLPGYRFLFAEILDWVLEHWSTRGSRCSLEVSAAQTDEACVLERAGFRRVATFYTRRFDLTRNLPARAPLEPGFTIVDMATHPDYRQQRLLRHDAFHDGTVPTGAELEREMRFYNYLHAGPIYHAPCDLCVMAEDGQFVAGCEALIDARNREADVERVCTHHAFRRRGFARAVIQECLARLRALGMQRAYITGYSDAALALYGSLGHDAESLALVYERVTAAPHSMTGGNMPPS